MNEHDKNFLKNMSPFLMAALVMFFMLVAFETKADEKEIVGYTEHGITVTKQDLQVKSINMRSIRGYTIQDNNVIRVRTTRKQEYDIELYYCYDLSFAQRIVFQPWGGFNTIGRGDKIIPISFGRPSKHTCTIKSVTAVLIEKEDE
jgi:hypothetical protein